MIDLSLHCDTCNLGERGTPIKYAEFDEFGNLFWTIHVDEVRTLAHKITN